MATKPYGDSHAISCHGLTKNYGQGRGLFDASISIDQGAVFGLIGPNGAGKSTLIKMLMDLVRPSRGKAQILGRDCQVDSLELKSLIGYLPGELMQFPGVSARYILGLFMNLRQVHVENEIDELAERLDLDLSRKYQELSHGNKQKVGLIQALMHRPKVIILDEPTLGLDPVIQREFRNLIQECTSRGSTVLLSSHVLSEVESVCDRLALIKDGRILKQGSLSELKSTQLHKLSVRFEGDIPSMSTWRALGADSVEINGSIATFDYRGPVDKVIKMLSAYYVQEFDSRDPSLEEVFFTEVDK